MRNRRVAPGGTMRGGVGVGVKVDSGNGPGLRFVTSRLGAPTPPALLPQCSRPSSGRSLPALLNQCAGAPPPALSLRDSLRSPCAPAGGSARGRGGAPPPPP